MRIRWTQKFGPAGLADHQQEDGQTLIAKYPRPARTHPAAFSKRCGILGQPARHFTRCNHPTPTPNRMVNIWKRLPVAWPPSTLSRSASFLSPGIGRGLGFRDSKSGSAWLRPHGPRTRARRAHPRSGGHQLKTGGAFHQYQPLTKARPITTFGSGFNDDPHWLILGVAALSEGKRGTGTSWTSRCPFENEPGSEQPLYEHLRRSLNLHPRAARPARPGAHRPRRLE